MGASNIPIPTSTTNLRVIIVNEPLCLCFSDTSTDEELPPGIKFKETLPLVKVYTVLDLPERVIDFKKQPINSEHIINTLIHYKVVYIVNIVDCSYFNILESIKDEFCSTISSNA